MNTHSAFPFSPTQPATRMPRLIICAVFACLPVIIAGCSIGEKIDRVTDTVSDVTGNTVAALDDAIDALDRNSSSWQTVLQQTTDKLTTDTQSTVRNEVSDLLSRSVAATGTELRCNVDFIGSRVRQALSRIRARLLHQSVPPVEPALCSVVPPAIDMALDTSRRNKLEFFGYDFDTTPIKVLLHSKSGATDVSSKLDRLTHYHMTLNLGSNGVPLSNASDRLTLEWENRPISSIAVIQPSTPVCEEKILNPPFTSEATMPYTPPHTRGDRDFSGNGPEVWATGEWINKGTHVDFRLWMKAKETKSDWTTAEGTHTIEAYFPAPSGYRIDSIVGNTKSSIHYVDTDHNDDQQGGGPSGPVKRFTFRGDRSGDDAGSYTSVNVEFNPLVVKLVQIANCAPASAVKSLEIKNLIAPGTLRRFQPMMLRTNP